MEHVCIANEEDADDVFGIKAQGSDVGKGVLDRDGYVSVAEQLADRFGFKAVAITLRESLSASDNNWAGMLYTKDGAEFSPKYAVHIVDRVGGGDSFGIHAARRGGICRGGELPQTLRGRGLQHGDGSGGAVASGRQRRRTRAALNAAPCRRRKWVR